MNGHHGNTSQMITLSRRVAEKFASTCAELGVGMLGTKKQLAVGRGTRPPYSTFSTKKYCAVQLKIDAKTRRTVCSAFDAA